MKEKKRFSKIKGDDHEKERLRSFRFSAEQSDKLDAMAKAKMMTASEMLRRLINNAT